MATFPLTIPSCLLTWAIINPLMPQQKGSKEAQNSPQIYKILLASPHSQVSVYVQIPVLSDLEGLAGF